MRAESSSTTEQSVVWSCQPVHSEASEFDQLGLEQKSIDWYALVLFGCVLMCFAGPLPTLKGHIQRLLATNLSGNNFDES